MDYQISVHDVPEMRVLSIRDRIPESTIPAFLGRSFGRLYGLIGQRGVESAGHPFVLYHEFGTGEIDLEVCAPIATDMAATEGLRVRLLPAVTVAATRHVGPYEELAAAYSALTSWIAAHGLESVGPVRERYLTGPDSGLPPTEYATDIEMPVARVGVPVNA